MEITDLIEPDRVIIGMRAVDKTAALAELARRAAALVNLPAPSIREALMAREELGSTGVGEGIAMPHARIAGLDRLFGLFARLERPIDFAAVDERPVDLVFLLLIPATAGQEHLAALAAVARRLRKPDMASRLRAADGRAQLYRELVGETSPG